MCSAGNASKEQTARISPDKDDLSLDTYLSHYLALQAICPVSILMVEQFT